jgi:hypothetical protein
VAAPVFRRIAERTASYLNLRPDLLPDLHEEPPVIRPVTAQSTAGVPAQP